MLRTVASFTSHKSPDEIDGGMCQKPLCGPSLGFPVLCQCAISWLQTKLEGGKKNKKNKKNDVMNLTPFQTISFDRVQKEFLLPHEVYRSLKDVQKPGCCDKVGQN